jgi:hypothetical protein
LQEIFAGTGRLPASLKFIIYLDKTRPIGICLNIFYHFSKKMLCSRYFGTIRQGKFDAGTNRCRIKTGPMPFGISPEIIQIPI